MNKGALVLTCLLCIAAAPAAQSAEGWLDRPLASWNEPAQPLPRSMPTDETIAELAIRCDLRIRRGTPAERALADNGWLPFLHLDRQIVQGDVEIVGGMSEADGMCRPSEFNMFVFVAGRLAGTLSPLLMSSRTDGVVGAVRLAADETISAEFARYRDSDPLCCPSSRVSVRYRIERKSAESVVVPVSIQIIR
ncbi:MAG TPA: LppP/LprE family lipoprotein [Vicinamibacterales bacterium]|nr:LppP/LprE family lipoprotein [Vicinamibacterales bacterium]